jgi:hypothetical protein
MLRVVHAAQPVDEPCSVVGEVVMAEPDYWLRSRALFHCE